ncbi:uncharacterized protein CCR75_009706 [Bremia lactucae]|uniref:Uncharacterized protein n=1 Tax=Bremia lactucae TaxID=4779 RepID=A0A976IDJ7_BRELC|nr:hypothetical protein CCR75_000231 [Bremia lactucae]TDH68368.1 hypothetical protein CCR75_009706 [Bremia lactucae]
MHSIFQKNGRGGTSPCDVRKFNFVLCQWRHGHCAVGKLDGAMEIIDELPAYFQSCNVRVEPTSNDGVCVAVRTSAMFPQLASFPSISSLHCCSVITVHVDMVRNLVVNPQNFASTCEAKI